MRFFDDFQAKKADFEEKTWQNTQKYQKLTNHEHKQNTENR